MTTKTLSPKTIYSLLDNQPEPVVYFIPIWKENENKDEIVDFEIAYCNNQACQLTNSTTDQLLGQKALSMPNTNDAVRKMLFQQLIKVYSTGLNLEENYYNPVIQMHFNIIRSKIDDGVLTIARNITSSTLLMDEKLKQIELTNSILDSTIDPVMALDAIYDNKGQVIDFQFIKINRALCDKLGLPEKEILNKTYLTISPHANQYGLLDLKLEVFNNKQPVKKEIYFKGLGIDGWYTLSIVPLGENGLVETFSDITETKKIKEKVEQGAQVLETIVNTSKAGMFTLVPVKNEEDKVIDFRFGIVNQAVASYIGQTAEMLRGSLGSTYFPAYKLNGLFDIYKDTYLNGVNHNFDFHYEDGYDVFFNIDVVKMKDGVLVTFTDHTNLKRLQRELELKINALARSNSYLEEFAHAASHDLKEPLRKIRIFADRLKNNLKDRMNEVEANLFDRMEVSTERMQLLVDDLLEFSHVSQDPHQKELINLNEKIERVITDLELPIEEKGAKIEYDALPTVKGYKRQSQQLFQNLISNALKYSKEDIAPLIQIHSTQIIGTDAYIKVAESQAQDQFYLIEVKDNGIGFEQQYADRIFDMFQRLHGKSEYSGTGVGLSIARKVVENRNGYIWATSQIGNGATFSVLLPVNA